MSYLRTLITTAATVTMMMISSGAAVAILTYDDATKRHQTTKYVNLMCNNYYFVCKRLSFVWNVCGHYEVH